MADNKQNTNTNVPNLSFKREQSESCFDSAERVINQKQNVPNLRFPEFTGEYEKYNLGELGSTLIGLTYSPADVVSEGGTIVLRSSNIKNGVTNYDDIVRVNKKIKDSIITRTNDILVCARNGSPRLIGKNAILKESDSNITFGAFMMIYRSNDNTYIHQLLSTKRFYSQVGENLGARINQITTSDFNSFEFYFPKSKEERIKIASLLALIDKRIETQNKIIEDLKKLKVAICNRLLNNKTLLNKTAPLSNFGELKNGYAFKSSTYVPNGNYNIITIANVSGDREIVTDSCNTILSVPIDIQSHQILKSGDILISLTGNVGRVSLNKGNNNLLNQRVGLFVPNNSISAEFIYQSLSFVQFENSMINLAQGAAQMNIGKGDIESYQIRYSDNQQLINSISRILLDYDIKIEIENKYLQSLLSQKAYLLSNLFI